MHHGVTFSFGSAKVYSPAIFETCFSHDKDIWIAATDYYMYFFIIVRFPLTSILQLINYSIIIFSLLITAVILLLNCLVLILYLYIHFLSPRIHARLPPFRFWIECPAWPEVPKLVFGFWLPLVCIDFLHPLNYLS